MVAWNKISVTGRRIGIPVFAQAHRIALVVLQICALGSLLAGVAQANPGHVNGEPLKRAVLSVHNQARSLYRLVPMEWDDRLASEAADWARHLVQLGYMTHSSGESGQGENIWMGTAGAFSYDVMLRDWADESRYFQAGPFPHISSTGDWRDVGHFTQMIWKDTRRVGCAVASGGGWDYLVCRYSSPGNVFGEHPLK